MEKMRKNLKLILSLIFIITGMAIGYEGNYIGYLLLILGGCGFILTEEDKAALSTEEVYQVLVSIYNDASKKEEVLKNIGESLSTVQQAIQYMVPVVEKTDNLYKKQGIS